jgi:hypothetical protein
MFTLTKTKKRTRLTRPDRSLSPQKKAKVQGLKVPALIRNGEDQKEEVKLKSSPSFALSNALDDVVLFLQPLLETWKMERFSVQQVSLSQITLSLMAKLESRLNECIEEEDADKRELPCIPAPEERASRTLLDGESAGARTESACKSIFDGGKPKSFRGSKIVLVSPKDRAAKKEQKVNENKRQPPHAVRYMLSHGRLKPFAWHCSMIYAMVNVTFFKISNPTTLFVRAGHYLDLMNRFL